MAEPLRSHELLQDALEVSAQRRPDKLALVCGGRRMTYAEIEAMANRLAHAFRALGVNRGDRVVLALPNSCEAVVGIFAALKAGAVFVPVHPSTKPDKLRYILTDCQAALLLAETGPTLSTLLDPGSPPVPGLRGIVTCGPKPPDRPSTGIPQIGFESAQDPFSPARPPRQGIDLDLACLIYTSGSTGQPKGVMSDHSNVLFAAGSIVTYLENVESDIVLNVLPLSFDYGLYQLLMTFLFSGTLVLERSFAYAVPLLQSIERERVTGFPGVPTLFAMLLQLNLDPYDFTSLRYLSNTAAALPASHILEIRKKFPHATLFSMYGLTETKRTLYLPPAELDRRPGSVGVPIPGTEAWVEGEQGQRLDPGEIGELVVRGRHVMRGYWGAPELSAQRFRPGSIPGERLCYTGDLFRQDTEGFFYFIGRKDDIIKSRGEKVAPREIENVLYSLPGVLEAVVVGVPDPMLGQAVKALIVRRDPQLTEAQVLAHCRRHLEDYMMPKSVEFREKLSKTESGKIKRTV